jgi:hypothetical protein
LVETHFFAQLHLTAAFGFCDWIIDIILAKGKRPVRVMRDANAKLNFFVSISHDSEDLPLAGEQMLTAGVAEPLKTASVCA